MSDARAEKGMWDHLGDVCVLGLGKTGRDVALHLASLPTGRVDSVTLYGGLTAGEGEDSRLLREKGVDVVLGTENVRGHFDLVIASPGIPELSAFFRTARDHADEIIGEPEFAWRESPRRWVAITGTNGKTTTTTLTRALLKEGGLSAAAVGNIGRLATGELARRTADEWFVSELSSFQLAGTRRLHPRIACLLNITPDHIEWHGSLESYAAAKEKVFQNLDAGDLAIVSDEDGWCRAIRARLLARDLRVLTLSITHETDDACAAFVRSGRLVVRLDGREHCLTSTDELPIKGSHNVEDALAASAMALELGVSDESVCHGLLAFHALEHRIEPCGRVRGIRFVNDSKATNTDSVEKALTAFPQNRIVVLLGGHDKGTDLSSLARAVAGRCKAAICFGEAGERIARAVEAAAGASDGTCVLRASRLREAFARALDVAEEGDVVLLSPACSSFDEFHDMAERGRLFKSLVSDLVGLEGAQS